MKTGTGLALICVGAILAFAVTANNSVFNWNIAGWVIMLVGLFGLVIPLKGYAWVSRRLTVRQARPGNRSNHEVTDPTNVGRNPANSRVPAALTGPVPWAAPTHPPRWTGPGTPPPIQPTCARARPKWSRTSRGVTPR